MSVVPAPFPAPRSATAPVIYAAYPRETPVLSAGRPEEAKAGFAYSGPYTEGLLAGNLAVRLQKRVEYDAATMKSPNAPEADALIRKTSRKGFELQGRGEWDLHGGDDALIL